MSTRHENIAKALLDAVKTVKELTPEEEAEITDGVAKIMPLYDLVLSIIISDVLTGIAQLKAAQHMQAQVLAAAQHMQAQVLAAANGIDPNSIGVKQ